MNLMNLTADQHTARYGYAPRLMRYGYRVQRFPLTMALLADRSVDKVSNVVCSVAGGFVDLARFQAATHLGINHGAL